MQSCASFLPIKKRTLWFIESRKRIYLVCCCVFFFLSFGRNNEWIVVCEQNLDEKRKNISWIKNKTRWFTLIGFIFRIATLPVSLWNNIHPENVINITFCLKIKFMIVHLWQRSSLATREPWISFFYVDEYEQQKRKMNATF